MSPSDLDPVFMEGSDQALSGKGREEIREYVQAYLRFYLPRLPEEAIQVLTAQLDSDPALAKVSDHIGLTDLLLESDQLPYPDSTRAQALSAFVALLANQGQKRMELFIQDFLLTPLANIDINEIIPLNTPMTTLSDILMSRGLAAPESRLLRSSGTNTVTPVYVVGIYLDGELIGESAGETVSIAEDMAARDCLKRLWGTQENQLRFAFGEEGRAINVDEYRDRHNPFLADIPSTYRLGMEEDMASIPDPEDLFEKYKGMEGKLGVPLRKRQRHAFSRGSYLRRNIKKIIKPKPWTV